MCAREREIERERERERERDNIATLVRTGGLLKSFLTVFPTIF